MFVDLIVDDSTSSMLQCREKKNSKICLTVGDAKGVFYDSLTVLQGLDSYRVS